MIQTEQQPLTARGLQEAALGLHLAALLPQGPVRHLLLGDNVLAQEITTSCSSHGSGEGGSWCPLKTLGSIKVREARP